MVYMANMVNMANMQDKMEWICLWEEDVHAIQEESGQVTWMYPSLPPTMSACVKGLHAELLRKNSTGIIECHPAQELLHSKLGWYYQKYNETWVYHVMHQGNGFSSIAALQQVQRFVVSLGAKDFHPEKYAALLHCLVKQYVRSGDVTAMLQGYLSVFASDKYSYEPGRIWKANDYTDEGAKWQGCSVKGMLQSLGNSRIVHIWMAMLMKKRILVYGDDIGDLLNCIRSLPQLVWHRQCWDILRPLVYFSDQIKQDLKLAGVYCAGTLDEQSSTYTDYYDLFIHLPERRIIIREACADQFLDDVITCQLENFLVSSLQTSATDETFIKNLAWRTKELLTELTLMLKKRGEQQDESASLSLLQSNAFLSSIATVEQLLS